MLAQTISLIVLLTFQPAPNENLWLGAPSPEVAGKTKQLVKKGFVVMHDNTNKGPLWVAFILKPEYITFSPRKDQFKPDPELKPGERSELKDYRGSGFDRGHMAASADMRRTEEIQAESFLLSNMWPQKHKLNAGLWSKLEDTMRGYAKRYQLVQIYVGPIFAKEWPTPLSILPESIGLNHVKVPKGFFRIIVRKQPDGKYTALAFEMPNDDVSETDSLTKYLVSIRQVEQDTKLDFDSALPKATQDEFELVQPARLW